MTLLRKYKKQKYTVGNLLINGDYFCDTLEDTDRGLTKNMFPQELKAKKVNKETAIPTGTYEITMEVISPRFGNMPFYKEVCNGKLPRLLEVPCFDGILIHVGDGPRGADLTEGCILVGKNKLSGQLSDGKETFKKLYSILEQANKRKESIIINIK